LSYVAESSRLMGQKDFAGAVAAAEQAVAIAPDEYEPQVTLGDALVAVGRKDEARLAYEQALRVVKTMEPEAQEALGPVVEKRIATM
jgi:Flp pilus assembly protein TadD